MFKKTAISLLFAMCGSFSAHAADEPLRIGFITDLSGTYADIDGAGGVEAIKMAIADHNGHVLGRKIELLVADHQNKTDLASVKVREWMDKSGVNVIIGGTNSSVSLALAKLVSEKKGLFLSASSGTTRLTNEDCTPYTVQYSYDTYSVAKVTGTAVAKQPNSQKWFMITADLAFGHSLEKDMAATLTANGGMVVGTARHPIGASDFSSFVLQAKNSNAQILGLATGGADLINAIKSAEEFGVRKTMKVAAPLMFLSDVHALGLKSAQGLLFSAGWYWDLDDQSRAWSKRYFEKMKKMPSDFQAGDYSLTNHYLNSVKAANAVDSESVMSKMKSLRVNDMFSKNGYIRPDGRMIHDLYLMEVKTPAESKYPWDYLKIRETIPGDQAYITRSDSKCPLWAEK